VSVANQLDFEGTGLVSLSDPLGWQGTAQYAFAGSVTRHSAAVGRAADAFRDAATALRSLATTVEHEQKRVEDAAKKLHEARAAAQRAQDLAISARDAADTAQATASGFNPFGGSPLGLLEASSTQAEQDARAAERTAAAAWDHEADVERWAYKEAYDAVHKVEHQDGATADRIASLGIVPEDGPAACPAGPIPVTGNPLRDLGHWVFGNTPSYSKASLAFWLASPPPPPPPPPPPKKEAHHTNWWVVGGLGLATAALTVADIAQLGLDPATDGATVALGAETVAAAGGEAVAETAAETAAVDVAATAGEEVAATAGEEAVAGGTEALTEEEQLAAAQWRDTLEAKPSVRGSAANEYEVAQTGEQNLLMKGGEDEIWADGFESSDANILEAKHVGNPETSPFVEGSRAPEFIRERVLGQVSNEIARYKSVIADAANPTRALTIVTNDARAVPTFERLLADHGVPGRVVVRP
jgi:hypothetical protein